MEVPQNYSVQMQLLLKKQKGNSTIEMYDCEKWLLTHPVTAAESA